MSSAYVHHRLDDEYGECDEDDEVGPVEILPPQEMLSIFEGINVAAPMVRYSKLAFRHLLSHYNTHITHTPMILAQEFSRSAIGRRSDFSTSKTERGIFLLTELRHQRPHTAQNEDDERSGTGTAVNTNTTKRRRKVRGALIAQFAANDAKIFADACELVYPHVDGIDLNCGCPQKWAYQEQIGSWLLRHPDKVRDLVRAARDRTGWNYPISIKIRMDPDLKQTQKLVETAIQAGASHISVHGRTRHQPSTHPVDLDGIRFAVECVKGAVPVVANGDVWSYEEAETIRRSTGTQGVMSARGLLANPALFAGFSVTPTHAITNFLSLSTAYTLPFALTHKHIAYMLESAPVLRPPQERPIFSTTSSLSSSLPSNHSPPLLEGEKGLDSINNTLGSRFQGVPITKSARAHYHTLVSMAGVIDFLEEECGIVGGYNAKAESVDGVIGGGSGVVNAWRERVVRDQVQAGGD